jgi:molybdopterin-biosynthesis enzyme MoeA-like protein
MIASPSFYSVIIGTELLNGRRKDKHFDFLNDALTSRGWEQTASFVIKDDPKLIEDIFLYIKNDPHSVMFCYGGLGATPDDLTRYCAANVFCNGDMQTHPKAKSLIEQQFGDEAYPHRINMAYLPKDAQLLDNVVNNVPGFYLDERYFFTPGFPSMANAMVTQALDLYYQHSKPKTRYLLKVEAPENDMIEIMNALPKEVEFSSLPRFIDDRRVVEISIASEDEIKAKEAFVFFKNETIKKNLKILSSTL